MNEVKKEIFTFDLDEYFKQEEVNFNVLQIDTNISLDTLHIDWQGQAFLMQQAGEELAKMHKIRRTLRARLFTHIRNNDPGISEAKLQNLLKTNEDYIQIQFLIDKLDTLVKSLLSRRKGLENLGELWLNDYWGNPKEPKGDYGKKINEKKLERCENLIDEALNDE